MARPMKPVPVAQLCNIRQQLGDLSQQLADNPNIDHFSIQVDNRTGMITTNAQHKDGRVQHDQWVSKGLSQTTRFAPRALTIEERNDAVCSLLGQGLTQTEVAQRIGISQSRVAQIKKTST